MGQRYTYEVRAELDVDGKTVNETKSVQLTAGQSTDLAFNLGSTESKAASMPVSTTLMVKVPADARVYLAGQETRSGGEVREFTTTKLPAGSQWDNYTIQVVLSKDGRDLTKEQTITLKAGETKELSFDFGAPSIASSDTASAQSLTLA